ncbi:FAD-binding oxidoreductase [Thermodesulfobacteriota bacterium]
MTASRDETLPPGVVTDVSGFKMRDEMKRTLTSLRETLGTEQVELVTEPEKGGSCIVARPQTSGHVSSILREATAKEVAVIPSGSGLAGPGDLKDDSIVLDMSGMKEIVNVDGSSLTVTAQAGIRMKDLDDRLKGRGYIPGITPHPFSPSTLGGIIAEGRVGPYMSELEGTGELIVSMEAVLPGGEIMHSTATPRSATGPDIVGILPGSRGTLAVMTEITVRICRVPERRIFTSFTFERMSDGIEALRKIMRAGLRPSFMRLLDQESKGHALGDRKPGKEGVLLALVFEGLDSVAQAQCSLCGEVFSAGGGMDLGPEPADELWKGRAWGGLPGIEEHERTGKKRHGIMEVRSLWSGVIPVYGWIMNAASGGVTGRAVITQASPEGAAVWFVFDDAGEAASVRREAKKRVRNAAAEVCDEVGASIGFHSGVGLSKAVLKKRENPELVDLYHDVKKILDPGEILNPGGLGI